MPQTNGRIQLLMSGGEGEKRLQVMDPVSGVVMVEVSLDADGFMQLMSTTITGSVTGVPAFIAPDLDRVGKRRVRVSVDVRTDRDRDSALASWAGDTVIKLKAYSYSITHRREVRTTVTFSAYLGNEEQAREWAEAAEETLAALTPPLARV